MKSRSPFDKYLAYAQSVQSPKQDCRFIRRVYKELNGSEPSILREDFCAAFALCCEWVKMDPEKKAFGVDLDPEPLRYGRDHYLSALRPEMRKRVITRRQDVLSAKAPKADVICALNFSYFCFHSRAMMLEYFRKCRRRLRPGGILMVDLFGGPRCTEPSTDIERYPGLTYYWEQENYDAISHRARFHIHFKRRGEKIRKRVFTYDWRLWTIAEIRDLMTEAGFKDSVVYWEGTNREGRGSGRYNRREKGELCDVWMAYVAGRS